MRGCEEVLGVSTYISIAPYALLTIHLTEMEETLMPFPYLSADKLQLRLLINTIYANQFASKTH